MKPKLVSFKFTKKLPEAKGKTKKSQKNYENIFNDILSGTKSEQKSMPTTKRENRTEKSQITSKKNKIKYILKLETINLQDDIKSIPKNNFLTEEYEKNNDIEQIKSKTDKVEINKENDIKHQNFIDYYLMDKSIDKNIYKAKIERKDKLKTESSDKELNRLLIKKHKEHTLNKTDQLSNHIKCIKTMNNKTNLNTNKRGSINLKKNEENLCKIKYSYTNKLDNKSLIFNKNKENKKERKFGEKNKKFKKIEKKTFHQKTKNLICNSKKDRLYNKTVDKIKINTNDNDNNKEVNYKDYISINDNIKKKRLILNNTNSNINININITNINDKNIKKDINSYSKRKIPHLNTENNYKSNITTVNIINNNNISKKLASNDYRLLFYNYSNKKYLPHQTKITPQGIKIESIDINLNEEEQNPVIKTHKFKFKKNLKKNNYFQNGKNFIDNNEKETRSEYEHFLDREDYWSNKSSTSYSCRSGFTVTRKLRSLNRERDKIKMMNNLKNNENKIDKIENKLINIVNKFHEDNNSIISTKKKKKKFNFSMKKNIIKNKNYYTLN